MIRLKIDARLLRIELDNHLGTHKNLGGELYELKFNNGNRIYYTIKKVAANRRCFWFSEEIKMANKKTSTKPRKSAKKSTPKKLKVGGVSFERYSPSESLAHTDVDEIGLVLGQALASGDKEAFQEILAGFIRARNISQIAEPKVLSRTSIYEAIDKKKDPRVGTVFKILAAIKKSDKISA